MDQTFTGDISGAGAARWLMSYAPDGKAHFVGLQHVDGAIQGRRGTFVLETIGDFDGHMARWRAGVVEGSAAGQLATSASRDPHLFNRQKSLMMCGC